MDARADVFVTVVKWVIKAIKNGGLIAVLLENVVGILQEIGGKRSFMSQVMDVLGAEAPEFLWEVAILYGEDYCIPQSRKRVFLRGMRIVFLGHGRELPPVLEPFGKRSLEELLDLTLPATPREQLTGPQQTNLMSMLATLKKDKEAGVLDGVKFAVFAVDRAEGKVYKARYKKDVCPTLTCSNKYLFVVSLIDLEFEDDDLKICFRFVHPSERLRLQGFGMEVYDALPSDACAVKAAGNAYPVPFILANVHGMIKRIHDSGVDLSSWPEHINTVADDEILSRVESGLKAKAGTRKPKAVKKKPAAHKRPAACDTKNKRAVKKRPAGKVESERVTKHEASSPRWSTRWISPSSS